MSSFVKKSSISSGSSHSTVDPRSLQSIPAGCKLNISGTVVAPTGISSLDTVLGEGIPVGRLVILLEDQPRSSSNYANTILKCFIAQGLVDGNQTVLLGEEHGKMLAGLPGVSSSSSRSEKKSPTDEKMTIAWRYKHIQAVESSISQQQQRFGANFDLGKKLELAGCSTQPIPIDSIENSLAEIRAVLGHGGLARIAIRSLGSPLFGGGLTNPASLIKWFYELRNLVRTSNTILMATLPSYLYSQETLRAMLSLADCVLEIQSFVGTPKESQPAFKEYQGFLRVVKPMRLPDSYALAIPETSNLAFKCKQRRFIIEKFHLPPEGEEASDAKPSTNSVDF